MSGAHAARDAPSHDFARDSANWRAGEDRRWMDAALAFGRWGLGLTAPNPSVGALVLKEGVVVGRGVTAKGGRPHAERIALDEAGAQARGATLYVTLEPCSHTGKTPPCVEAILAAGVARVVSALEDPNPLVAGEGHRRLREAGVEVVVGVGGDAARRAHRGHILKVTAGRPMVTLKLAETADGYAAGDDHDARLRITGLAANARVQVMRSMHEAIMIGVGTAIADDPLLTVRLSGVEAKPLRVVLDANARLPALSRLAASAREFPTLVVAGPQAPSEAVRRLGDSGVEVATVALDPSGRVDLLEALRLIGRRGVTRVFSEGGPSVGAGLIAAGLADEVALFTAEKPLGRPGLPVLDAEARAALADPSRYRALERETYGPEALSQYERLE
jgi:diaminohydroxyphosphoribosylaminopyrimidine deaminase/5-amino-6-(5-phosphoribosylamino)uracil reductase